MMDDMEISPASLSNVSLQSKSIMSRLPSSSPTLSLEDLKSNIAKLESELATLSFDRKRLDLGWDERMIPDNQYYPLAKRLADKRATLGEELWTEIVTLRNRSLQEGLSLPITLENDGPLYFQRRNLYKDPMPSGKMLGKAAALGQMRREAIQVYGANQPSAKVPGQQKHRGITVIAPIKQLWCHVLKDWFGGDEMTAAQIVPPRMSIAQMDHYFGAGFGSRKYSFDNCLFVHEEIEQLMAAGFIVFVPKMADDGKTRGWKVKVLRKKVIGDRKLVSSPGKTLGLLDGTELYFRNDNRPATRFLFFHYLLSQLRNKENAQAGFAEDWEEMVKSSPFAKMGPFFPRAHLEALVDYVGHVRGEDVERIAEGTTFDTKMKNQGLRTNEANEYARRLF